LAGRMRGAPIRNDKARKVVIAFEHRFQRGWIFASVNTCPAICLVVFYTKLMEETSANLRQCG
jgi:hypothetical protein